MIDLADAPAGTVCDVEIACGIDRDACCVFQVCCRRWAAVPCGLVSIQWCPVSVTESLALALQVLVPQRKTTFSERMLIRPCGAFVSTTAGLSRAESATVG